MHRHSLFDVKDQEDIRNFIASRDIFLSSASIVSTFTFKYIAQFFDRDGVVDLERAVTWLIITIMFVFDPLAVLLLIAVNMSLKARYGWTFEGKGDNLGSQKKRLK